MSDHSTIEWTDATWNPITGCSVTSPGCKGCYAMKLAGTRLRNHPSRAGLTVASAAGPVWTGEVRLNPEWMDQPLHWSKPRNIFVCAHGDLFHESVPDAWIDQVFEVMAKSPRHTYQVLTKRASRMRSWFEGKSFRFPEYTWPLPNVWLGVSVEDQRRAQERIPEILATPAAVRWVSAEPLLEGVDFTRIQRPPPATPVGLEWINRTSFIDALRGRRRSDLGIVYEMHTKIDWVVVGGESGVAARPMHPDWARSLRDQCAAASVPFFFKQWGEWVPYEHSEQPPFLWSQHGDEIDAHWLPDFESDDGKEQREWHCDFASQILARRVGKKAAGRLLDGAQHDGAPTWKA